MPPTKKPFPPPATPAQKKGAKPGAAKKTGAMPKKIGVKKEKMPGC